MEREVENVWERPMRLAGTANGIDHSIRRHMVTGPSQHRVNSARDRHVALTAIGRSLKDQYDAAAAPIPSHLSALMEQFKIRG